jgi:hypothetical protein
MKARRFAARWILDSVVVVLSRAGIDTSRSWRVVRGR